MAAETNAGGLVGWLAGSRGGSGRVMLLLAALLAAGAAYFFYVAAPWGQQIVGTDSLSLSVALWLAAGALAFVIAGVRQLGSAPPEEYRDSAARITLLSIVGVVGAATFLLGLTLLYQWGDIVTKLLREGDRTDAWKVFVALLAIIGGLAVMFVGLQVVRGDERKAVGIRRAVYGFNAFLTGFLLLAVLIVANVIITLKFPSVIDTTKGGVYSISDRSKQILKELDKPTKVYLIMDNEDVVYPDVQSLLLICQQQNPKLIVENVSQMQSNRVRELARTFPQITEQTAGMLVVYGDEKSENASFVRARDLMSQDSDPMGGGGAKRKFLGEVKLMNELSFLIGGKDKPVVYFTQGSGEMDVNDRTKPMGMGFISDKLQRRNFDVKPLKLDPLNATIPEDAKIIVIAGPKQTLPPNVVDALKAYLDKGGKLLALFDISEGNRTDKEMPATGLEGVLSTYGVDVTKERVQTFPVRGLDLSSTDETFVMIDPAAESTPLAAPFKDMQMQFFGCRVVRAMPNPAGQTPYRAIPLLTTLDRLPVWAESDLQANGVRTAQAMATDKKLAEQRLAKEPLPIAVIVTESTRALPGAAPNPEKPKLAVYGDATFVSNALGGRSGEAYSVMFDLFAGTLDWLRERPTNIGIEPRMAATYELTPDAQLKETQLKFLPLLVSVVGVLGLGLGIWLVRRQ
jgi:ABC-type uncharacterized transport system